MRSSGAVRMGLLVVSLGAVALQAGGCAGDPPKAAGVPAAAAAKTYALIAHNPASGGAVTTYSVTDLGVPTGVSSIPVSSALDLTSTSKFTIVADSSSATQTIKSYLVSPSTGALTLAGGANGPGEVATSVTVNATGGTVYATYGTSRTLYAYSVDATVGTVSIVTAAPTGVAVGAGPHSTAITSDGKFVYVANAASGSISAFESNATTGGLTAVSGTAAAGYPVAIKVEPTGKYAYTANFGANSISGFVIASTGGLTTSVTGTPISVSDGTVAGTGPVALAVDTAGKNLYVVNQTSSSVTHFSISATDGSLTRVGVTDLAVPGTGAASIAISPSGLFMFVTATTTNSIFVLGITPSSGALSLVGPVPVGGGPGAVRFIKLQP